MCEIDVRMGNDQKQNPVNLVRYVIQLFFLTGTLHLIAVWLDEDQRTNMIMTHAKKMAC